MPRCAPSLHHIKIAIALIYVLNNSNCFLANGWETARFGSKAMFWSKESFRYLAVGDNTCRCKPQKSPAGSQVTDVCRAPGGIVAAQRSL
jgi:hypothetical protein